MLIKGDGLAQRFVAEANRDLLGTTGVADVLLQAGAVGDKLLL